MAPKTSLTANTLEGLGVERLAALLLELADGDAAIKRRVRLEIAGAAGPRQAAHEIGKRLTAIGRGRSYLQGPKGKAFLADLEGQRRAITAQVVAGAPGEALALLWQMLDLADGVYNRCDDSNGTVTSEFKQVVRDLAEVATVTRPDPKTLAERTFAAIQGSDYGHRDALVRALVPALGREGLEHLKARVEELARTPVVRPADKDRVVVGWSTSGKIYADEIETRRRESTVRLALADIADGLGDVDGYIAQFDPAVRAMPDVAAGIASRLLAAGRAGDALAALDAVPPERRAREAATVGRDCRLAALEALGREAEAQTLRWRWFETTFDRDMLRDYLKRLPDFDDVEAEERAKAHVAISTRLHDALWFFVKWPDLARAAALVEGRTDELDGDFYEVLTPTAEALDAKHPLAATLVRRAMIDFTLAEARYSRYRHAARHLAECRGLAAGIDDFGAVPGHEGYVAKLRAEHGKKRAFWQLFD